MSMVHDAVSISFTAFCEHFLTWQHVGNVSADCGVLVENTCRIPEKPLLTGNNIAYRRKMELFHLSPPFCLGFLGTNPLTISHV